MASTPTPIEFNGLSPIEIGKIMVHFGGNDSDPVMHLTRPERMNIRRWHFLSAVIVLQTLGVQFEPEFSIEDILRGDTATTIYIGKSWSRDLHGLCFNGDVASLEDCEDERNSRYFKSLDSLVEYVQGVIDE
jgi:hypothetical protein